MTAVTVTLPTWVVALWLSFVVCVPVWFASCWLRDRLQERIKAHYDRKIAELEARAAADDGEAGQ